MNRFTALPPLALLCALFWCSPASAQRIYDVSGTPTAAELRAFPEARCIWRGDYPATLAFVRVLGSRGMRGQDVLARIDALSAACGWRPRETRGDIISAVAHLRGAEVDRCLSRTAGAAYRRFRRTIAGQRMNAAATRFVEEGFPLGLAPAVERCDPDLAPRRAYDVRYGYWHAVFVDRLRRY